MKYNNRTRDEIRTSNRTNLTAWGILDLDLKQNKSDLVSINSDQTFDMAKKKIKGSRELHHFFEKNNIETENEMLFVNKCKPSFC